MMWCPAEKCWLWNPTNFHIEARKEGMFVYLAINLNGLDHPKFHVNKRSIRDRLTLLITKHKAKMW